jgi:hypothetical protein
MVLRFFLIQLMFQICSFYNLFACNIKELPPSQIRQPVTTYPDTSGRYQVAVEIDASLFKYESIAFTKMNAFDSLIVKFYEFNPCDNASADVISEYKTVQNSLNIKWKEKYKFIKIFTNANYYGKVGIKLKVHQDILLCSSDENRFNAFESPVIGDELSFGSNCYELCNTGCKPPKKEESLPYQFINAPVKWVEFPVTTQTILNVQCTSPQASPIVLCYGIRNGKIALLKQFDMKEGEPNYLHISEYEAIRFGIYFLDEKEHTFDLCLYKFPVKKSCIDFFEKGHELSVIYTSKGSPKDGPYLYGEAVTFSYKVIDWMPINHNWLHGVHIMHGTGWKGMQRSKISNKPIITTDKGEIAFDSLASNKGIRFVVSDTVRAVGYNIKNLILPGYYFKYASGGPAGPTANYRWGKKFDKVRGTLEKPLYEMTFTLLADSIADCSVPLDGFVEVVPLTDFETGKYDVMGCNENQPIEMIANIKCCQFIASHSFKDSTLCHGTVYDFTILTMDSCTYQITNIPLEGKYNLNQLSYNTPLELNNDSEKIDSLVILIKWNEGQHCNDSIYVTLKVKPSLGGKEFGYKDLCQNQKINLSKDIKNQYGNDAQITLKDLNAFDSFLDKNGDIWVSSDHSASSLLSVESDIYCTEESQLRISPNSCTQNDENYGDIILNVNPNPTLNNSELHIKNGIKSENWTISIYDGNARMIHTFYEFIPYQSDVILNLNMEHYTPGMYSIHLSDGEVIISKKVIKLKS